MHFEFRVFQIPIRVRVWFVLTAFVLALLQPEVGGNIARLLVFMGVVASAVLAHELGHALAGKAYGWQPLIEFGFVGGVTYFERRGETTRARRMLLIALGPLVGLVVAAIAWSALAYGRVPRDSLGFFALDSMLLVNFVWGGANLVPMLPFDGGHLVVEIASAFSPTRGRRIAGWISIVLAIGLAAFATYHHLLPLALCGIIIAWRNHRLIDMERAGYDGAGIRSRDLAYVALTRSDAPSVVEFARRARNEAKSTEEADEASYLLAWGRFLTGDASSAREALVTVSPTRTRDYALEGAIAHDLGELDESLELFERALPRATPFVEPRMLHAIVETRRFDDAAVLFEDSLGAKFSARGIATVQRAAFDVGEDAASVGIGESLFRKTRDASVAFLLACSCSRLGRLEDGLEWLRRARQSGFSRLEVLDTDPALGALRATPGWDDVRAAFEA